MQTKKSGFTLLEILLVIGIIAILAGIVIIAINPSKQLAQVRNFQRKSDIKQLYNAITQYYIDNSAYPATLSTTALTEICNTGSVASTSTSTSGVNCATAGLTNLSTLVPTYLVSIPTDPTGSSSLLSFIPTAYAATNATGTGYKVGVSASKQVLTWAPLAELNTVVTVGNVLVPVPGLNISGLVAHYLMNDNADSYTVLDNKGNYNGTAVRKTNVVHVDSGSPPNLNGALSFTTASGDYISMGTRSLGNTSITISAWVKTASGADQFIFGGADESICQFSISVGTDHKANMYSYNTGVRISTTATVDDNAWHHIVYWYNSSSQTMKIYVDGAESATGNGGTMTFDGWNWYLGRSGSLSGAVLTGTLDDVRVYNRALTTGEISQIYNGGAGTEAE